MEKKEEGEEGEEEEEEEEESAYKIAGLAIAWRSFILLFFLLVWTEVHERGRGFLSFALSCLLARNMTRIVIFLDEFFLHAAAATTTTTSYHGK